MSDLIGMSESRWHLLMQDESQKLTQEELQHGWHWCIEWDGLLVGPNMHELRHCSCPFIEVAAAKQRMPGEEPPDIEGDGPSVLDWDSVY